MPQSTVDGWSLPNHNSVVTASAPPVTQANTAARPSVLTQSVPTPFVPPPSYHQIVTVNQRDSALQSSHHTLVRSSSPPASATPDSSVISSPYHLTTDHQRGRATQSTPAPSACATFYSSALSSPYQQETQRDRDQRLATLQSLVAHFEDRGNFASARVIARLIERSSPLHTRLTTSNHSRADDSTAIGNQRRPQTPSPLTGHTDVLTDPSQRSWRSYFNTADRLRDLTGYQGDIANEASVPTRRYQPRSQTPPPAYHLVEQTAVRITRADSLPSYDDFMATPHKYTT